MAEPDMDKVSTDGQINEVVAARLNMVAMKSFTTVREKLAAHELPNAAFPQHLPHFHNNRGKARLQADDRVASAPPHLLGKFPGLSEPVGKRPFDKDILSSLDTGEDRLVVLAHSGTADDEVNFIIFGQVVWATVSLRRRVQIVIFDGLVSSLCAQVAKRSDSVARTTLRRQQVGKMGKHRP